ncbi:MAG: HD-GYP domain-containing protein [Candidatus Hydrothermia bacterium]
MVKGKSIDIVLKHVDDLMKQMEGLLAEFRSQNEALAEKVKKRFAREAVARAVAEAVFYAYDIGEIFDLAVRALSKLEKYDLTFFLILERFRESNSLRELYISDPNLKEFIKSMVFDLLNSAQPFYKGFNVNKKIPGSLSYKVFFSVPCEVEDMSGILGVFSNSDDFPEEEDFIFLEDLITSLSIGIRQEMMLKKLAKLADKLRDNLNSSISLIQKIIELKDVFGRVHGENVASLVNLIGKKLGVPEDRLECLIYAAKIHDVGKVGLPVEILNKPGALSEIEYEIVKLHPQIAYEFLRDLSFPLLMAEIIYQHHERLDGSGYPRGLKDDEILFEARILAVCEVVEAMSHFRTWRDAIPIEKVLSYIEENKGVLFDPRVVDACIAVFKEGFSFPY